MSLPRRRNVIPFLLAFAAVALTLVAANRLIHPDPLEQGGNQTPAAPAKQPTGGRGPVVLGTVTSAPLAYYGLPETLSAGKVVHVIEENIDVQPGTVLIKFDDTLARRDLGKAEAAVQEATVKVQQAQLQEILYPFDLALQEFAVKAAAEEYASSLDALTKGKKKLENALGGTNPRTALPYTEAEKQRERDEHVEIMKGEAAVRLLAIKVEAEQKKLEKVKVLKPALLTAEAAVALERLKEEAAKAKYAVDAHVIKAGGPGVVAQVQVGTGAVIYPQSPPPILVVPAGPRYVRAEVEPEFAYKLAGSEGKPVVIYDNNNFALTYAGTVKQIGRVYLPKRGQGIEAFANNNTKVLEVLIEVTDAAPAGKPPLLVNQPVRVSFP